MIRIDVQPAHPPPVSDINSFSGWLGSWRDYAIDTITGAGIQAIVVILEGIVTYLTVSVKEQHDTDQISEDAYIGSIVTMVIAAIIALVASEWSTGKKFFVPSQTDIMDEMYKKHPDLRGRPGVASIASTAVGIIKNGENGASQSTANTFRLFKLGFSAAGASLGIAGVITGGIGFITGGAASLVVVAGLTYIISYYDHSVLDAAITEAQRRFASSNIRV